MREIRAAIEQAGGAIPFERFMDLALYGSSGFYGIGGAGRRGDFLTSPEVGPLFGTVLTRFLEAEWERLGRPDLFTVVEAGAGRGTLARSVLAADPVCAASLRYVTVEVAESQRSEHPPGVESRPTLPPGPIDGVVVANELLDNLPFRLVVFDGAWREAFVGVGLDGTFVEHLSAPLDPLPEWLPASAPHGARAPVLDAAAAWVTRARSIVRAGSVLAFDYARPTTAELAMLPWRDWLRTYRRHQRGGHYLAQPGTQDVTTELALDQLPTADERSTQREFLERWGIRDLVDEGRRAWEAAASRPDLAALAMRSRSREADALTDPGGLGGFTVLQWRSE